MKHGRAQLSTRRGEPGWFLSPCATRLGAEGAPGGAGTARTPLSSGLAHGSEQAAALGQSLPAVAGL